MEKAIRFRTKKFFSTDFHFFNGQRNGHGVGVRLGAERRTAGGGSVCVRCRLDALIERILRTGIQSGELGAALPVYAVLAILTAARRIQRDAVLGGARLCGRGGCIRRGRGNRERPAVSVKYSCAGCVLVAAGVFFGMTSVMVIVPVLSAAPSPLIVVVAAFPSAYAGKLNIPTSRVKAMIHDKNRFCLICTPLIVGYFTSSIS